LARQCTVCAHADADKINAELVGGATLDALSKAYGLNMAALHRHKKHIPAQLVKAQDAQEVAAADNLMGRIASLNTKAEDVYRQAIKAENLTAAIAAVRELRGITELYAKITGELQAQTVNNIIIMPEWVTLRNAILYAWSRTRRRDGQLLKPLGGLRVIHKDLQRALDPVEFSRYIGIEPDEWQAEVLRYEGKRLLLNCSRQSGKSTTTSTKALHTGIYRPKSLILLVSPSLRQSQELFRKVKDGYEAMEARPGLLEDNRLSMVLANGSRIVSLPSGQSTVRGFSGVTMILEDEASQVKDDFYYAVLPMLIINNGTFIAMTTPYGK
jgi:hypothetical protein